MGMDVHCLTLSIQHFLRRSRPRRQPSHLQGALKNRFWRRMERITLNVESIGYRWPWFGWSVVSTS